MRYLLLVCWCLAGACSVAAQTRAAPGSPDTLRLQASNSGPWARYFAYCFVPIGQPATGPHAVALAQAGRFQLLPEGRVFQAGYTRDRLWLRAVVVNTLPQRTRFVWSLYAFVDSAVLFVQPGGLGAPRRTVGTSGRTAGPDRPLASRALCLPFWLEAGQTTVAYLRVDNFTGATYLPTDLTTTEDFLAYEANFFATKRWAWLLGLYVSSALFNLILYALLRDPIHLWYGAYVAFSSWFLLMEDGLDAVLLPAGLSQLGWQLGQYSLLLLALGCGLRILALFVHLRQGWPRLHRLS